MAGKPRAGTKTIGPIRISSRTLRGREQWRAIWTENGKTFERNASTEAEIDQIAAAEFVRMSTDGGALQPHVPFESLAAAYLDPRHHADWRSDNTRAKHLSLTRNHLLPSLGALPCSEISPADFNRVLTDVANAGYAARTVKDVWDSLRGIVEYGQRRGVWGAWDHPLDGVGIPASVKVKRIAERIDKSEVPTRAQVEDLAAGLDLLDPNYGLMVRLMASSGLRWGELNALRPQDVDLERRRVSVDRQVLEVAGTMKYTLPKHEKTRTTVFGAELVEPLREAVAAAQDPDRRAKRYPQVPGPLGPLDASQHIFLGPRGGIWRRSSWGRHAMRPARDATSYPDHLGSHGLRHYWVTALIAKGGPEHIPVVSKLAGHHSPRFTADRYWGADDDYLDEALRLTA